MKKLNELFYIILIIVILQILYECFNNRYELYDNFVLNKDDRLYIKLQDLVFNENHFYKNDIDLFNKYGEFSKWNSIKVLDAGTGFGRHYNELPNNIEKIGVDKENLYLERAEIRNPEGKFILGKLENNKLFNKQSFSHILCTMDTIYNNRPNHEMDNIISNFRYWLKDNGILAIHIYEKNKDLDPAPRNFSLVYNDKSKSKHALTYFEHFTHDAVFKNTGKYLYEYVEKYIMKSGNTIKRKRELHIIPKEDMMKKLLENNFKLYHKEKLDDIGIDDFSLYFFKKQ
jgi:hypothetical protein